MFQLCNGEQGILVNAAQRSSRRRQRVVATALVAGLAGVFQLMAVAGPAHADSPNKFSPDLLRLLKADPDSGMAPRNGLFDAAKKGAPDVATANAAPAQYHVLVRVNPRVDHLDNVQSHYFSRTHIHSMVVSAKQLVALTANPGVLSISLERRMVTNDLSVTATPIATLLPTPVAIPVATPITIATAVPLIPLDVNPVSVGANTAGSATTGTPSLNGQGVTVAILDSGVSPVDDISRHLIAFQDFVNGQTAPYDDYGHGTHVAGIVAGDGTDSSASNAIKKYQGIAPGANIVGVKVLDGTGMGTSTNVISGIEWCIANQQQYNIRVINMSLTGPVLEPTATDPVCQAVEAAVQAGIVVVVSAGNEGGTYGMIGSPANDPYVITVGASNDMQTGDRGDDRITTYTSRGPTEYDLNVKPDIIAPGNKVVSLRVPGSYIDLNNPYCYVDPSEYLSGDTSGLSTNYTRLSGTSMSAPAVAGAAALLLQENSGLYPSGVKLALMYSAQLLTGPDPMLNSNVITYDPFTQGAGELNIPGAVQLASIMTPSGLNGTPAMTNLIGFNNCLWFGAVAPTEIGSTDGNLADTWWGSSEIWSDPGLWSGNNLTWSGGGDNLTWSGGGDNLTWSGGGDNLTWSAGGDNLTWSGGGDNLTWSGGGDNLTWSGGGDNLTWSGGGDNLTWSGGGDSPVGIAIPVWVSGDNLTWSGGGDSPVGITTISVPVWISGD